jgi:hypothetical protein
MPAVYDSAYAKWLTQHGEVRAQGVNVLEFVHPKWGAKFVSDYGEPFAARTEGGVDFTAEPLGFIFDSAVDNFTTEQKLRIRLDNANGAVTNELRSLSLDDLQTPVQLIARAYIDTKRTAPAYQPVELFVTNTKAMRAIVECEASADALPNVSAGMRYTFDLFPPLVFL